MLLWIALWWGLELRSIRQQDAKTPRWFTRVNGVALALFLAFWAARMTVFFSSPAGAESVLTKNLTARILRWDWSNTHSSDQ
jgi:hypothetical protein